MAIIDPKGLFLGDRLAMCSDEAQLHWTRLYAAANNFARMELNYRKVVSAAYASFKKPPSEEKFWSWIKEYHANFLLFIYQDQNSVVWGQWQTNERYLLGHKNADDKRSPAPPADEQDKYRAEYLRLKESKSQKSHALADLFGVIPVSGKEPRLTFAGEGVGEGVGEVSSNPQQCPPKTADVRKKSTDPIGDIYKAYPRHLKPRDARYAIEKAVKRLVAGEKDGQEMTPMEARRLLWKRARGYALSPAGRLGDKTPYPATWFNASQYLDDDKEWQIGGQNGFKSNRAQEATNSAIDSTQASINRLRGLDFDAPGGVGSHDGRADGQGGSEADFDGEGAFGSAAGELAIRDRGMA